MKLKKNLLARAVFFTYLCVAVTFSGLSSGTLAKYTWTSENSEDTARMASFSYTGSIGGGYFSGSNNGELSTTLDLFKTITEEDTITGEQHVLNELDDNYIAPGVGGNFTIQLENTGEVAILGNVSVSVLSNTAGIPIQFSTDKTNWYAYNNIATLNAEITSAFTTQFNGEICYKTVYWRWIYNGNNTFDNTLGVSTEISNTLTAKIDCTVTQVD